MKISAILLAVFFGFALAGCSDERARVPSTASSGVTPVVSKVQPQPLAPTAVVERSPEAYIPIADGIVAPTVVERHGCSVTDRKVCFSLLTAELKIDESGRVMDATIVQYIAIENGQMLAEEDTRALANEHCLESFKRWRFRPASKDGKPVRVKFWVTVAAKCSS